MAASIRIISGQYKGRRLQAPSNLPVRPTTDFAKEGLFNVLEHNIQIFDSNCLDLFAGTGNITYELISRGAKLVVCVEKNYNCCRFIEQTKQQLDLKSINVVKEDVFVWLKRSNSQSYNIIFADPPYDMENIEKIPDMIFSSNLLAKDGWFILEHSAQYNFTKHPQFYTQKRYGKVNFSIFKN